MQVLGPAAMADLLETEHALEIDFMWRLNKAATHPGEKARIQISGSKSGTENESA